VHIRIERQYLCDVYAGWTLIEGATAMGTTAMHQHVDHPAFTAARDMLFAEGYIHIETRWSNGDSVLEDFTLNNYEFKEGDQFPCACALGIKLKVMRRHETENIK